VLDLEEMPADLAFDLRALLTVVEVEIVMGCIAAETDDLVRYLWRVRACLHGAKALAVKCLILG
jgi:hypothetical protein